MKRTFFALSLATLLMVAFGGRVLGAETVALYDNLELPDSRDGRVGPVDERDKIAQPFWTGDSDNVSAVTINIARNSVPTTGELRIEIWDDDGTGLPGTRVGVVGTIDIFTLSTEWTFRTVHTPVTGLAPNTRYFVLLDFFGYYGPNFDQAIWVATYESDLGAQGADLLLGHFSQTGYTWRIVNTVFPRNNFFPFSYLQMAVFSNPSIAAFPSPTNETSDTYRDVLLSWSPGVSAATHDVYLGTSLEDVSAATRNDPRGVLASQGRQETQFAPGRLDFGQTYYWRVDEVNGAPDYTIFPGGVWRFEVEPIARMLSDILVTASSMQVESMSPENTINGSGLDDQDGHGNAGQDMWLSSATDGAPWIQFAFDRPYALHEMWVWNQNQSVEPAVGLGAKEVTIRVSSDGETWSVLAGVPPFAQAPGLSSYLANTRINFGGQRAKYIRLEIASSHGVLSQAGLSEVRFYYLPTYAREPKPAQGATGAPLDTVLSWRSGREAASHDLYLSDTMEAVVNEQALMAATQEPSFDLSGQDLKYGTTYYWQVNEVNDLASQAVNVGHLWHFQTAVFMTIDDMEAYADEALLGIRAHWTDGLDNSANGAVIGNGNEAEIEHVFEGNQSLPMAYDNTLAATSEATRTFSPPLDWVRGDPSVLSLFFSGDPTVVRNQPVNDPASLYVVITDSVGQSVQVDYPDPAATHILEWTEWVIPLGELNGLELASIASLTLGVGGDGGTGQGKIFFDNIRVGTPVE